MECLGVLAFGVYLLPGVPWQECVKLLFSSIFAFNSARHKAEEAASESTRNGKLIISCVSMYATSGKTRKNYVEANSEKKDQLSEEMLGYKLSCKGTPTYRKSI
jgi:hypothetical protein